MLKKDHKHREVIDKVLKNKENKTIQIKVVTKLIGILLQWLTLMISIFIKHQKLLCRQIQRKEMIN